MNKCTKNHRTQKYVWLSAQTLWIMNTMADCMRRVVEAKNCTVWAGVRPTPPAQYQEKTITTTCVHFFFDTGIHSKLDSFTHNHGTRHSLKLSNTICSSGTNFNYGRIITFSSSLKLTCLTTVWTQIVFPPWWRSNNSTLPWWRPMAPLWWELVGASWWRLQQHKIH